MKKFFLTLLFISFVGCTPGVSSVMKYSGKDVNRAYLEIVSFKVWAKSYDKINFTYYTTTKVIVHNPTNKAVSTRLICYFLVGDYIDSTVKSKMLFLPSKTSSKISPITNLVQVSRFDLQYHIDVTCELSSDNNEKYVGGTS